MDWKQFFAAIASSLAWPTAVVVIVLLLREPLTKLIPLIRSFKFKDFHIDLGEKLEVVKEDVAATASDEHPEPPPPIVVELARLDPRAAVLSAWVNVEKELTNLAAKHGVEAGKSLTHTANMLHAHNVLDELTFRNFVRLRRIRNEAAHMTTRDISFEEAVTMADMCQWLVAQMEIAGSAPKAPSA